MSSVRDNYKDYRAEVARDLNTNHLHPDKPPAVACAVYLAQWRVLRKKRQTDLIDKVCKAKPGKRREPTWEERSKLFFQITGKRNENVGNVGAVAHG